MSLREAAQKALDVLSEWDALIKHQYNGPRDAMTDMHDCAQATPPIIEALRDALAEADRANPMQCEPCGIQFADKQPGSLCPRCYREVTKAEAEKAEPVAWTPVTTRMPPYGDEKKVVCYTDGHDYAGTQFITLRASDFYEYDPDESDEPGTPEAKTVSHWIYEDDLIAAARGKG